MERDFIGLGVKQESPDEIKDGGPSRGSVMQWPFAYKTSAPRLLSFSGNQDEIGFYPRYSAGFATIVTREADHRNYQVEEKQGDVPYPMTVSPSVCFGSSGQNPAGFRPLTGVPVTNTVPSGSASQLTIFYNGSVCVYDNITPEKAQAIMSMAGVRHPPPAPTNAAAPQTFDGLVVSKPYHSSPIPLTSIRPPSVSIHDSSASAKPAGFPVAVPQFRHRSLARFLEKRKERMIKGSQLYDEQSRDCSSNNGRSLSFNSSDSCLQKL